MKAEDFTAPPCACPECFQAGVTDKELRRDPRTGKLMHGHELRRWYEARDKFFALKASSGPKSMDDTQAGKTPKTEYSRAGRR